MISFPFVRIYFGHHLLIFLQSLLPVLHQEEEEDLDQQEEHWRVEDVEVVIGVGIETTLAGTEAVEEEVAHGS